MANPAPMSSAMTAVRASREVAIVSPSSAGGGRGHPLAARRSRQGVGLGDLPIGVVSTGVLALPLQFEPDRRPARALDAPLVRQLVDQEQAPAGAGLGGLLADGLLGRL